MALKTYKLGELIEPSDERNSDGKYGIDDVRGISTGKEFIETKANMDGVGLASYKVVKQYEFAYVSDTSRRGDKISLAYNKNCPEFLVSSISTVFRVKQPKILFSDYLFIYFNRPEFDRFSRFNSWGSARETFSWVDLCDIDITLPDLPTQQKYVDIYESMVANQKSYEKGLDDLKLTCDAYIEELRRKTKCEKIGPYLRECNERNSDLKNLNVQVVESSGNFAETKANTDGLNFSNYKIVKPRWFAYNPSRINLGSIALQNDGECIVSPMYCVFEIINQDKLLPEYLMLWFSRKEFQRSTLFYASGSVRDTFTFSEMCSVQIPIPDISVQRAIVDIYKVYTERKCINEQLKQQIKDICPILIKGSLEE